MRRGRGNKLVGKALVEIRFAVVIEIHQASDLIATEDVNLALVDEKAEWLVQP